MAEAGAEHPGGCTILKMRLESAIPHRARGDIPARQSELARGGDLRLVLDNRGHGAVHTAQPRSGWEAWMVVPLHNTHEGGPLAAIACTRRPGDGRREAQAPIKVQK